jgi:aspartyl-tRNA(Asn)/glutamyl-tRNA(Gln) amidotransferase subunit B
VNRAANEVAANLAGVSRLAPGSFAQVVSMEAGGQLTATQAKAVLAEMLETGGDPEQIAKARGFEAMAEDALMAVIDKVIADHPAEWERFVAGEDKVMGVFSGDIMKATDRKADGKAVRAELLRRAGRS